MRYLNLSISNEPRIQVYEMSTSSALEIRTSRFHLIVPFGLHEQLDELVLMVSFKVPSGPCLKSTEAGEKRRKSFEESGHRHDLLAHCFLTRLTSSNGWIRLAACSLLNPYSTLDSPTLPLRLGHHLSAVKAWKSSRNGAIAGAQTRIMKRERQQTLSQNTCPCLACFFSPCDCCSLSPKTPRLHVHHCTRPQQHSVTCAALLHGGSACLMQCWSLPKDRPQDPVHCCPPCEWLPARIQVERGRVERQDAVSDHQQTSVARSQPNHGVESSPALARALQDVACIVNPLLHEPRSPPCGPPAPHL